MSQLQQQVWINQLQEKFYPDTSFLKYVKDFTAFVNNQMLTIAEAGLDPEVFINSRTYPIAVKSREDIPHAIELDLFETENSLVREPEVIEFAYNQLESVLMGHRNALRATTGAKAAHAFAPNSDSADTPVLVTTGVDDGTGRRRMQVSDILKLKTKYDNVDYPLDKRYLVLDPLHVEDLILEDLKTFKDIVDLTDGQPKRFAGFNMLQFTKNPKYNISTMQKLPWATIPDANTVTSSFSFYGDEVMKADGNVGMYQTLRDPKERATIVGFDKRFIAMPIRNKGIGAILSSKV